MASPEATAVIAALLEQASRLRADAQRVAELPVEQPTKLLESIGITEKSRRSHQRAYADGLAMAATQLETEAKRVELHGLD